MTEKRKPYQLVSLEWKSEPTIINVNGTEIGNHHFTTIAGPCAVETEEQIHTIAGFLSKSGIRFLRGGAYKPRTSPYSFQGLREEGLVYLRNAADKHEMNVITEVMDTSLIEKVYPFTDIFQVGARNMQNYQLLKMLSKTNKPVMLKRAWGATIEEWLLSAEYLLLGGNQQVILCERGIRSFDDATRNVLDLASVSLLKSMTHLPVIVDPSQATGLRELVPSMTLASMACGANGVMIEVHNQPEEALSDGRQSLYFDQFTQLQQDMVKMGRVTNCFPDFAEERSINY
jgi:3-deoxy-7-phosphoheptulonate synthase